MDMEKKHGGEKKEEVSKKVYVGVCVWLHGYNDDDVAV